MFKRCYLQYGKIFNHTNKASTQHWHMLVKNHKKLLQKFT